MKDKVNYVVACWGEGRTSGGSKEECLGYLRAQISCLNGVKHNLAQVTIVHPDWSGKPYQEYQQLLDELDGSVLNNGTPVVVRRRPNIDRSYGGFSDVYGDYRMSFDYYIITEDDYLIIADNFDQIMIDMMEEKECDYLCTLISHTTCAPGMTHAGMTAGMCRASAMEVIWQKYGTLLHDESSDCNLYWNGQLSFSYPYTYCGLKIADFADEYSTPFWYAQANRIEVFREHDKHLIVPIQWYRQHKGAI